MNDDRRAALEAIAYGDDSDVRPGDRLRALELLDDAQRRRDADWQSQRKSDTDPELLARLDRSLAGYVLALAHGTEPPVPELPETAAALREAQERARAEARAALEPEPEPREPEPEQADASRTGDRRARAPRCSTGPRARGPRACLAELEASPAAPADQ